MLLNREFVREKCGVLAMVPYNCKVNISNNILRLLSVDCQKKRNILYDRLGKFIDPELFNILYVFTIFLEKLNHRGYDGYGYGVNFDGNIYGETFNGKISYDNLLASMISKIIEISYDSNILTSDNLRYVVGHVRYCTSGSYEIQEHQPYINHEKSIGICFNGNIDISMNENNIDTDDYYTDSNCSKLTASTKGNMECIHMSKYFEGANSDIDQSYSSALKLRNNIDGAYSTIVFDDKRVYGFRDDYGTRPLVFADIEDVGIISSETCIIESNQLNNILVFKDISSSQFISIDKVNGVNIKSFTDKCLENLCLFEYMYFSDARSMSWGKKISDYRYKLGSMLGRKETNFSKENSVVVHIPKSSYYGSMGYGDVLGAKNIDLIKKSDNYNRSFIQKKSNIKETLNHKFIISDVSLLGKRVYLIDDSLVRGNTMLHIIEKIRRLGAEEIHLRIPSPMIKRGCNLGICTVDDEVICRDMSIEELCEYFNVDSIIFLETHEIIDEFGYNFCLKCFDGD